MNRSGETKEPCIRWEREGDIPADCKYREYQACGRYLQLSLVGDHSSAGFRCQYCNNFVHLCAVNYVGKLVICPVYGN